MVDYQMTRNDQIQKLRKLRRFLRENHIGRGIATLVLEQARDRLSVQAKIQEEDVLALRLLSTHLRTTIRFERFREHLSGHALFRLWMDMDVGLVREIAMEAMESTMVRPQDDVFVPGSSTSKSYCIVSGRMTYTQEPATAPVCMVRTVPVELSVWICEASLWSHWVHVGTAKARTHCQVLSISGDILAALLHKHTAVSELSEDYGRAFHRRIVNARPPHASWPNDLQVPFTEYSDMVVSLQQQAQVSIGLSALDQTSSSARRQLGSATQESVGRLREEVYNGKSCLMVNVDGILERVVSVVVLEMINLEDAILVELGKLEPAASGIRPSCQRPALKQQAGEMGNSTFARLLERLYSQPEHVQVVRVERQVEWKNSKEFGVRTKYLRTVHYVKLLHELRAPVLALGPKHSAGGKMRSILSDKEIAGARRFSRASNSSAVSEYLQAPVYKIQTDEKSIFYSWLSREKFEYMSSPAGEKELNLLLGCIGRHDLDELSV
mmetsp:Transcript_59222/g.183919  ORF Transcript_59222/g.183919 Transcript_59222/m.183919 type:complete len:496 (-) Transcript_59222:113-1600(-)